MLLYLSYKHKQVTVSGLTHTTKWDQQSVPFPVSESPWGWWRLRDVRCRYWDVFLVIVITEYLSDMGSHTRPWGHSCRTRLCQPLLCSGYPRLLELRAISLVMIPSESGCVKCPIIWKQVLPLLEVESFLLSTDPQILRDVGSSPFQWTVGLSFPHNGDGP